MTSKQSPIDAVKRPNVPEGWQLVRLGEVASLNQGGTPPKSRPEFWGEVTLS